jgi:hypothetical protein
MMTPIELTQKGFKVLVEALGYVDAVRFLRQFDCGNGDYTQERDQWLNSLTMADILEDIKKRQNNEIPPTIGSE